MSFKRIRQTTSLENGVLHELSLSGFQVFVWQPDSDRMTNLINYGFTAPTFLVFPDKRGTAEYFIDAAEQNGHADLARKNGASIIIVNPKGESWENEAPGAYEAVTSNLGIADRSFRDGLAIIHENAFPDEIAYNILGSCVRLCVYAFGTGADYVAKNYLRPISGDTELGDLGRADATMVCCTLIGGTALPKPQKNDIRVTSVGNTDEYNNALRELCGEVRTSETLDIPGDFDSFVGSFRRWMGKVVPAYNYAAEGIVDKPEYALVPISDDNRELKSRFPWGPKEHKVGYVTFYGEDLDVKNGRVPLVLVFHGGGDSAYATASLAEWPEIAKEEGFIVVAVEKHLSVSATEVCALIDHLMTEYSIDPERVYATGFSMGGIKSWDLMEQYPERFAALMPMDAIDEVGHDCFGGWNERINKDTPVPLFYVGGASSPLPELPCQAERAVRRIKWASEVNRFRTPYDADYAERDNWPEPHFGAEGDETRSFHDDTHPESVTTVRYFKSSDGRAITALVSVTEHSHEIRPFTNRLAWSFAKRFRRTEKGIEMDS